MGAGLAREAGIPVVQQTVLPTFPPILGNNEHRLPGSKARFIACFNETLRECAEREGVDLLAVDAFANARGLGAWHNPVLWHRAKQEVSPARPGFTATISRVCSRRVRAVRPSVLSSISTIRSGGGVIGDDGLDGIVLGQGSAMGEAFLDLQAYALEQAKRGVILAVCSKNDEGECARSLLERHPDMLLKRGDVACFVANWDDKAKNIRRIARELNIGLDSLVFVDDNPFERNLVRSVLPMVAVPEIPEDLVLSRVPSRTPAISKASAFPTRTANERCSIRPTPNARPSRPKPPISPPISKASGWSWSGRNSTRSDCSVSPS